MLQIELTFSVSILDKIREPRQRLVREYPPASVYLVFQAPILDDFAGLRRNAESRHPREHVHVFEGEDLQVRRGLRRAEGSKFAAPVLHLNPQRVGRPFRRRNYSDSDSNEGLKIIFYLKISTQLLF